MGSWSLRTAYRPSQRNTPKITLSIGHPGPGSVSRSRRSAFDNRNYSTFPLPSFYQAVTTTYDLSVLLPPSSYASPYSVTTQRQNRSHSTAHCRNRAAFTPAPTLASLTSRVLDKCLLAHSTRNREAGSASQAEVSKLSPPAPPLLIGLEHMPETASPHPMMLLTPANHNQEKEEGCANG